MTRARPLRFLVLVLGLWIGARAVMLAVPGSPVSNGASEARTPSVLATPRSFPPDRIADAAPLAFTPHCCFVEHLSAKTRSARPA